MPWEIIVALALIIPVVLFPAAFVWYLNVGGLIAAARERNAKTAREKATELAR